MLRGYPERWHGLRTWCSYFVILIYMNFTICDRKDLQKVLRIILFSGLILTTIGVLQAMSLDPFRLDAIKQFILPIDYIKRFGLEGMKFTFEVNRVYMTLYNPNNVGLYTATIIPICIYGVLNEKSTFVKGLWVLLAVLSILCMVGSYSRTGLIVLVCSFIFFISFNFSVMRKNKLRILVGFLTLVILCVIGDYITGNVLSSRMLQVFNSRNLYTNMNEIETIDPALVATYNGVSLRFEHINDTLECEVKKFG